jgi:hypothetical protein
MGYGKSLEKPEPHYVKLRHNNGQPLMRKTERVRMSKKQRLRERREEQAITHVSAETLREKREEEQNGRI